MFESYGGAVGFYMGFGGLFLKTGSLWGAWDESQGIWLLRTRGARRTQLVPRLPLWCCAHFRFQSCSDHSLACTSSNADADFNKSVSQCTGTRVFDASRWRWRHSAVLECVGTEVVIQPLCRTMLFSTMRYDTIRYLSSSTYHVM